MADQLEAGDWIQTDGSAQEHRVPGLAGGVRISAPGMVMRVRCRAPEPLALAADAEEPPSMAFQELERTMDDEGFEQHGDYVEMEAVAAPMPSMAPEGEDEEEAAIMMEVEVPPGHGMVALEETPEGILQIYMPESLPALDMENNAPLLTMDAEPAVPTVARFAIPMPPAVPPGPSLMGVNAEDGAPSPRRGVRFFRFVLQPFLRALSPKELLLHFIVKVEKKHKPLEGLVRLEPGFPHLTPEEIQALSGGPTLILLHGVFSSVDGAFHALPVDLMAELMSRYGGRVVGYDHWTIGKTPLQTAEDLLNLLPDGMEVDILAHSRGGLTTRALLEHPDLADLRGRKLRKVRTVMVMAGGNEGSAIARKENWQRLLNVFFVMGSLPGVAPWAGVTLGVLVGLLKVLVHAVGSFPSLEALADQPNPFLTAVNASTGTPVRRYVVAQANFEVSKHSLMRLANLAIDKVFQQKGNDLVVPFAGAAFVNPNIQAAEQVRVVSFGSDTQTQGIVWHSLYFAQPEVQAAIREELT